MNSVKTFKMIHIKIKKKKKNKTGHRVEEMSGWRELSAGLAGNGVIDLGNSGNELGGGRPE